MTFGAHPEPWMVAAVRAGRVARLATHEPDGRVHLVPCCYALLDDDATIVTAVDAKPKRSTALRRLANVAREPDVALVVDHYHDERWDLLWWVRLRGRAREVDDPAARDAALDALVARYRQYREQRPTGAVLAVAVDDWRGWRAAPG